MKARVDRMVNQARSPMDDWKPIESAPKDSILLLLARVKDAPDQRPHPIVGVWLPALDQWKPVPHFLNQHAELIPSMWIRIPQFR